MKLGECKSVQADHTDKHSLVVLFLCLTISRSLNGSWVRDATRELQLGHDYYSALALFASSHISPERDE